MLEWRRQRKEAIKSEIARLQRQASRVEQWQQVWGPDGAAGLEKVNKELLSWLEANGAKVRKVTRICQHAACPFVPYRFCPGPHTSCAHPICLLTWCGQCACRISGQGSKYTDGYLHC